MKLKVTVLVILILTVFSSGAYADRDIDAFTRAKLLLFDKKWQKALTELEKFISGSPNSKYLPNAVFYKAKCLEEMKMPEQAITTFQEYLLLSRNESLKEEANIAIIHLSFQLYRSGDGKKHLQTVYQYLASKEKVLRYFAAFELSNADDKSVSRKAVPVLKKMIRTETDQDLVDRGKIALLKIGPEHLRGTAKETSLQNAVIKIRITSKKTKKQVFSFNFPFALAALVLDAIPDEEKSELEEKGYSLDQIIQTLVKTRQIMKIEGDESIFEIWIE